MEQRIKELLEEIQKLPDPPDEIDLFGPKYLKNVYNKFFEDVLNCLNNKYKRSQQMSDQLNDLLQQDGLCGSLEEIYERINAGGHPIRDTLILYWV